MAPVKEATVSAVAPLKETPLYMAPVKEAPVPVKAPEEDVPVSS